MVSKPLVPPWDDGGKTLVRELVAHGRRFKYRVPITAGGSVPWPGAEPWPVYSAKVGYSPSLASKLKVFLNLLMTRTADIRHFFFAPNWASSFGCRMVSWARPGPVVQTVCSAPQSYSDAAGLLFGKKVIVLSDHTRRNLVEAGVKENRLVVIPPGVTVPEPAPPERVQQLRKQFGFGEDLTVLYAGDYGYSKAARTVLQAAIRVCTRRPDTRFMFACRIKNQDCSDEEQRLKALTAQANLSNRITFTNFVSDFPDLLTAVDLCVLPAETVYAKIDLPLTLLEAMARNTPVVVADGGPLPELLKDEVGEKVQPLDSDELAGVIEKIFSDPPRFKSMSEKARAVVCEHFSGEQMASRHEDLYREMSNQPS